MRAQARFVWAALLLLCVGIWARTLVSRNGEVATSHDEDPVARWADDYVARGLYTKTPIELGFSRAFSKQFTNAHGVAEVNFETGQISVSVEGLDPLPDGTSYEVWLVDQVDGKGNTAAIDVGPAGDRILKLGGLSRSGSLTASVENGALAASALDMAAVMRVTPGQAPEYVVGGMQSIRFQIGREARTRSKDRARAPFAEGLGAAMLGRLFPVLSAQGNSKKSLAALIAQGNDLFFNGTFGGNGRTCGTCHRANREFSIDADFIATLPAADPLFVAEFDPRLPAFNAALPTRPAMEDPVMMRTRGLVLENIQGFALDASGNLVNPPVFRASPSLFNLEFSAPYGLSDCCADLQTFSAGAVVQHFTRTLGRVAGTDFVLPTAAELKALEAFMLSNRSPANGNIKISGRNSLLSTTADPRAVDTARPEIRGRDLFLTTGCTTCHTGTVFSGGVPNLNTGVEALEGTLSNRTPTIDHGDGLDKFQVPQLFGLRKQHFFHSATVGNNTLLIQGQSLRFSNLRQAVSFYVSTEFRDSPEGQTGLFAALLALTDAQIEDITHFLEKISVN